MNPGNCSAQNHFSPFGAWTRPWPTATATTITAGAGPAAPGPRDAVPSSVPALIGQLQRCTAEQVDEGLEACLRGLLDITQAQSVSWRLVDGTESGPALCVASSLAVARAGHHRVGVPARLCSVVEHTVRPGRVMFFEFSWDAAQPADLSLVSLTLAGVSRWLNWLDLSHGPLNGQGAMPASHRQVLFQLLTGQSEKQIPTQLDLNPNTVHRYVTAIYRRYGVRNRGSLLARWLDVMR
ncbi:MAG TPA: helix-turn-helix transcriptional regulator [Candidatus Aquabacterium excrementipullorum]|nr:helix-turn-helix transcriptional regulator [Candidatus Aquabacterium excrementipullorum]